MASVTPPGFRIHLQADPSFVGPDLVDSIKQKPVVAWAWNHIDAKYLEEAAMKRGDVE